MKKLEETSLVPIAINHEGRSWSLFKAGEQGEALVKDVDVAKWLGYTDPHKIRDLIERHSSSLGEISATMAENAGRRGRPGKTYYLTEAQALRLAARSETPNAEAVLDCLIAVFMAARRGVLSLECDHGDTYVKAEDPRSDEEKRVLISTLLKAGWGECSDRVIARGLFVSHTTVSKIRKHLGIEQPRRLGIDGRAIDTSNIGSLPKPKPELELLQQLLEGQAALLGRHAALQQEVAELRARPEAPQLPAAPVFTAEQVTALLKGAR